MKKDALVFWFTGLSGAGKTTLATAVKTLLESRNYSVLILDGDDVRKHHNVKLGFTEEDIKKNNKLIAELCANKRKNHDVILVPIISPYKVSRRKARNLLGKGFFEIYLSADLETVIRRDVKGLYNKALQNEIDNMIGISKSNAYEPPTKPDLIIDSGCDDVEESTAELYKFIIKQMELFGREIE
jgi:adenylyl-sulfate kinase